MRLLALAILWPCLVEAQGLAGRIEALERRHPALSRAFWGAKFVDLETGESLYEHNAHRLFVPASNTKLFTTALALRRLGPDHRFLTLVVADSEPGEDGVLAGDLRLVGGGDPTISGRKVPYERQQKWGDPLAGLEELADLLAARRLRAVEGAVVGDDSAYADEPYPPGWAIDDLTWDYGAPISALTLNDNMFRLLVRGAYEPGSRPLISLDPPVELYQVDNRVATVASGAAGVFLNWPPGARRIEVWGTIPTNRQREFYLAMREPALYAATVFDSILRRRGITIRDSPKVRRLAAAEAPAARPPEGVELARRTSPPLFEILKIINKVSQNLHAELVLREVGRVRRNMGSRTAGLEEMQEFLREAGIEPQECRLSDGSGLSRLNLVSLEALVKLLTYMYLSADRDGWLETLPIGGEDGTLSHRFRGTGLVSRVFAKTGTLTHVSALAGYLDAGRGALVAFAVVVNNSGVPAATMRRFIDELVSVVAETAAPAPEPAGARQGLR